MKKIIYTFIFLLPIILLSCSGFSNESELEKQLKIAEKKNQELKLAKELDLLKEQNQELIKEAEDKAKAKAEAEAKATEETYAKGMELANNESWSEAFEYFKIAADNGHALAQFFLGFMYQYGFGVMQSHSESFKWYKLALEQGVNDVQYKRIFFEYMYDFGEGVIMSQSEVERLGKLVEQGDASAQFRYAVSLMMGTGATGQSWSGASELFTLAAEQGHVGALSNLAVFYAEPDGKGLSNGVTQNYPEAIKLFKLAASLENAYAQRNLGLMYDQGLGVTQSYSEARKWYTLAAKQGIELAKERLEIIKNK